MNTENKFWAEGELSASDAGELIKLVREKFLNLTMEALAKEIGTSEKNIGTSEKGGGLMGFNVLGKICKKYNLEAKIVVSELEPALQNN